MLTIGGHPQVPPPRPGRSTDFGAQPPSPEPPSRERRPLTGQLAWLGKTLLIGLCNQLYIFLLKTCAFQNPVHLVQAFCKVLDRVLFFCLHECSKKIIHLLKRCGPKL